MISKTKEELIDEITRLRNELRECREIHRLSLKINTNSLSNENKKEAD